MHIHCELVILLLAMTVHTEAIYGGREAVPHSRPYMVLLERMMPNGETKYCGGFLLNEDFVMTAAFCEARSYNVILGLHNFRIQNKSVVQIISTKQSFPQKRYKDKNPDNQMMLLKLSSKAKFNNYVKPIALADLDDPAPKSCIVSGWGRHNTTGYMSLTLREANVTLIQKSVCADFYCSADEEGPVEGDGGSPLVCENGKAYGVAAFLFYIDGSRFSSYSRIPDISGSTSSVENNVFCSL
ncbi:granzyme G-like [Sphaeramia orbicularis]|uniref:trypsin n=1 Tax=Sphaeramia orbicularis TaxID=375764 RepID=A0A672YWK0_9TELE|nr:granzyme G-like [Sphaeramia orbicularis]XP_029989126.1 granzyme G-like [Sphaeramia orbicularis]